MSLSIWFFFNKNSCLGNLDSRKQCLFHLSWYRVLSSRKLKLYIKAMTTALLFLSTKKDVAKITWWASYQKPCLKNWNSKSFWPRLPKYQCLKILKCGKMILEIWFLKILRMPRNNPNPSNSNLDKSQTKTKNKKRWLKNH